MLEQRFPLKSTSPRRITHGTRSNEKLQRLLRQYLPKAFAMSSVTQVQCDHIANISTPDHGNIRLRYAACYTIQNNQRCTCSLNLRLGKRAKHNYASTKSFWNAEHTRRDAYNFEAKFLPKADAAHCGNTK